MVPLLCDDLARGTKYTCHSPTCFTVLTVPGASANTVPDYHCTSPIHNHSCEARSVITRYRLATWTSASFGTQLCESWKLDTLPEYNFIRSLDTVYHISIFFCHLPETRDTLHTQPGHPRACYLQEGIVPLLCWSLIRSRELEAICPYSCCPNGPTLRNMVTASPALDHGHLLTDFLHENQPHDLGTFPGIQEVAFSQLPRQR